MGGGARQAGECAGRGHEAGGEGAGCALCSAAATRASPGRPAGSATHTVQPAGERARSWRWRRRGGGAGRRAGPRPRRLGARVGARCRALAEPQRVSPRAIAAEHKSTRNASAARAPGACVQRGAGGALTVFEAELAAAGRPTATAAACCAAARVLRLWPRPCGLLVAVTLQVRDKLGRAGTVAAVKLHKVPQQLLRVLGSKPWVRPKPVPKECPRGGH